MLDLEEFRKGIQRIRDRGEFDQEEDTEFFQSFGSDLLSVSGTPNTKKFVVGVIERKSVGDEQIRILEEIGIEMKEAYPRLILRIPNG